MAKKTAIPTRVVKTPSDGDGKSIANRILLGLSHQECSQILPRLEFVRLKLHQVLHEAGETIKSGYFVNAGLISILAVQPDGKTVEVGLIGREGFAGLPLLVGYRNGPTRVMTQGDGTAYRAMPRRSSSCSSNILVWRGGCIDSRTNWRCRAHKSLPAIDCMTSFQD